MLMTCMRLMTHVGVLSMVGALLWISQSVALAEVTSETRKTNEGTHTELSVSQTSSGADSESEDPEPQPSEPEPQPAQPVSGDGGNDAPAPIPTYSVTAFRGSPGADNACIARLEVPVGTTVSGTTNVNASIGEHRVATGSAPPPCNTPPPSVDAAEPADPEAPAL